MKSESLVVTAETVEVVIDRDRLVVVVVLCDLEKVVRTDAAKDERKMAEDIE